MEFFGVNIDGGFIDLAIIIDYANTDITVTDYKYAKNLAEVYNCISGTNFIVCETKAAERKILNVNSIRAIYEP
jgi:hypothetical protein